MAPTWSFWIPPDEPPREEVRSAPTAQAPVLPPLPVPTESFADPIRPPPASQRTTFSRVRGIVVAALTGLGLIAGVVLVIAYLSDGQEPTSGVAPTPLATQQPVLTLAPTPTPVFVTPVATVNATAPPIEEPFFERAQEPAPTATPVPTPTPTVVATSSPEL